MTNYNAWTAQLPLIIVLLAKAKMIAVQFALSVYLDSEEKSVYNVLWAVFYVVAKKYVRNAMIITI